jgi:hypothetical protein
LNVLPESSIERAAGMMRAANGTKFSPRPSYCKASVDRATNSPFRRINALSLLACAKWQSECRSVLEFRGGLALYDSSLFHSKLSDT